jgi:FLVCR family feline leukemia virus subgroup C receptor-related protein
MQSPEKASINDRKSKYNYESPPVSIQDGKKDKNLTEPRTASSLSTARPKFTGSKSKIASPETSVFDEKTESDHIPNDPKFLRKRKFMSILYFIGVFTVGFLSSPLAPVAKQIKNTYKRSLDQINLASSLFSFCGIITGFLANYTIHHLGIRKAVLISAFCFTIGCGFKMLIEVNFFLVHLGVVICGLGVPFVQSGIGNFADYWYDAKGRQKVMSLLTLAGPLGTMTSFVYPFFYVKEGAQPDEVRKQVKRYHLSHLIYSSGVLVLMLIFFRERTDEKRPQLRRQSTVDGKKPKFKEIFKTLFKDGCFVCIFLAGGLVFGALGGIANALSEIMYIWGYSQVFGGIVIIIASLLGIPSSVYYSIKRLNKPGQLRVHQCLMVASILGILGTISQFLLDFKLGIALSICVIGIGCYVGFTLMVPQVAKRVGSIYINLGTGCVYLTAQFFTAMNTYILGFILEHETRTNAMMAFGYTGGVFLVSLVLSLFASCLSKKPFKGIEEPTDTARTLRSERAGESSA